MNLKNRLCTYASGVRNFMQSLSSFLIYLLVTCTSMPWLQGSFRFIYYGSDSLRRDALKGAGVSMKRWGFSSACGASKSLAKRFPQGDWSRRKLCSQVIVAMFVWLGGAERWWGEDLNLSFRGGGHPGEGHYLWGRSWPI